MENTPDIKSVFKDALNQTISNYAEKARATISHMILHICAEVRPYMIVTEAGAETISEEIFTVEICRDFIFNLLFNFCPRLSFSNTEKEFSKLVSCLAFTLAVGDRVGNINNRPNDGDFNKLPEDISRRLPNHETINNLLEANKWLVMVLMISLYISVEDFPKPPESDKPSKKS